MGLKVYSEYLHDPTYPQTWELRESSIIRLRGMSNLKRCFPEAETPGRHHKSRTLRPGQMNLAGAYSCLNGSSWTARENRMFYLWRLCVAPCLI